MNTPNPKGENIASSPLFKTFLTKAEDYLRKPLRIKQLLNDAYQKASEKNDLGSLAHEAWETLQVLFRLVRTSVSGEYTGLPTPTVVAAVAVLIYFLSPIDLIPDFIPVIGLLDDVALLAWFTTKLKEEMDHFVAWEQTRPAPTSPNGPVDRSSGSALALTSSDGTTANSGPKPQNAPQTSPDHTENQGVEAPESAKRMGTADLDHPVAGSNHPHSNTDSGISSPDSSNPNPSLTGPNDTVPKTNVQPRADDAYNTDGSRTRNDGPNATGGNVR